MSGAQELADEKEFKAAFSLLPKVLNLLKKLSSAPGDPQKHAQPQAAIEELKIQLQRCRHLLECCSYLDQTPEQQQAQLAQKKESLKQMCDLLMKYKDLELLTTQPPSATPSSVHR